MHCKFLHHLKDCVFLAFTKYNCNPNISIRWSQKQCMCDGNTDGDDDDDNVAEAQQWKWGKKMCNDMRLTCRMVLSSSFSPSKKRKKNIIQHAHTHKPNTNPAILRRNIYNFNGCNQFKYRRHFVPLKMCVFFCCSCRNQQPLCIDALVCVYVGACF